MGRRHCYTELTPHELTARLEELFNDLTVWPIPKSRVAYHHVTLLHCIAAARCALPEFSTDAPRATVIPIRADVRV